MADFSELPIELTETIIHASTVIGAERAMIALQGLVHTGKKLTLIDGVLRHEAIVAVRIATINWGVERLVQLYQERLTARFPELVFSQDDEDEPVEPKKRRRS